MRTYITFFLALCGVGTASAQPYGWLRSRCCNDGYAQLLNVPGDVNAGRFDAGANAGPSVFNPAGTRFYVLSPTSIRVYNTIGFGLLESFSIPAAANGSYTAMAISPDGSTLAVAASQTSGSTQVGLVSFVNTTTGIMTGSAPLASAVTQQGLAFSSDNTAVYAASDKLYSISTSTLLVTATYALPSPGVSSGGLGVNGTSVYLTYSDSTLTTSYVVKFTASSGAFGTATTITGLISNALAVSSDGSTVYVGGFVPGVTQAGGIATFSSKKLKQTGSLTVGESIAGIAVLPGNADAYLMDSYAGTAIHVDLTRLKVKALFPQDGPISAVQVNPTGTQAIIINATTATMTRFDVATRGISGAGVTTGYFASFAGNILPPTVSTLGAAAYAPGAGTILGVTGSTGRVSGFLPGSTYTNQIALSPDGTKIYGAGYGSQIFVVDTTTKKFVTQPTFFLTLTTVGVAITADGLTLYAPAPDGNIGVYTASTLTLLSEIPGPRGTLALSRDGKSLYVAQNDFGSSYVTVISTATNTVTGTITIPTPVGFAPTGMVIPSPTADIAYVTTSCLCGGTNVAVIDTANNVLLPPIVVNDSIGSAGFIPDGTKAYLVGLSAIYEVQTSTGTITTTIPGSYGAIGFAP